LYTRERQPRGTALCKAAVGKQSDEFAAHSLTQNPRRWKKFGFLAVWLYALMILAVSTGWAASSQEAMAHLGAGLKLFDLQRFSDAAKEFSLALSADPKLLNARYHLAVAYFNERKFDDARQQFKLLAATGYHKRWVIYYLGRLDLQDGRIDEAIRRFQSLQGQQPLHDEWYYLGSAFLKKGELQKAALFLKREIAFNPRDFRARYLLGQAYLKLDKAKQAEAQFQESDRLHQYYLQGKRDLAACRKQLQMGQREAAWKRCGSVVQTTDIDRLVAVGTLFGEFSDYQHALEALQQALALDPQSPEINYNLGYTYFQMGNYSQAARYSQAATSYRPDFFEALEVYGMALHKLGKDAAAHSALSLAHQLRPDDKVVTEALAQTRSLSAR
jgi:tetratricopeptide (TPR) repeat protein